MGVYNINSEDICIFALREAEKRGAEHVEVYLSNNKESEVFIESNDLKQSKSQQTTVLGVRALVKGSIGFSSTNLVKKEDIINAVEKALKLARVSPTDRFNSIPNSTKVTLLRGIYDRNAESFKLADATKFASKMLNESKSFDNRISVDSGNFTSSVMTHVLLNSNGLGGKETISTFFWAIMGMAIDGLEVSNFDHQFGGTHHIKSIDVLSTAKDFARNVVTSLGARKIDSFKGEMLLSPTAATELIQDVIGYSINSHIVQKGASKFQGMIDKSVSSELLTVEDDATNIQGLGVSSFDREGIPHRRNLVIEDGILRTFLYSTYTANKDNTESTGNAGGTAKSPPKVSSTNIVINAGKFHSEKLIQEIEKGILINRFSGNVNPVNGDFSGVVKGGQYIRSGEIKHSVKEVMVAGNLFDALHNLNGISKDRKLLLDSILPYMRFSNISFTAG